jgi:hypothetical protein
LSLLIWKRIVTIFATENHGTGHPLMAQLSM